jgi:hypothetical protein
VCNLIALNEEHNCNGLEERDNYNRKLQISAACDQVCWYQKKLTEFETTKTKSRSDLNNIKCITYIDSRCEKMKVVRTAK